jgi:hypothetical protein
MPSVAREPALEHQHACAHTDFIIRPFPQVEAGVLVSTVEELSRPAELSPRCCLDDDPI